MNIEGSIAPMNIVTVYRVGPVEVGNHTEKLLRLWDGMDAARPTTQPTGRSRCVYASPNAYGMSRWIENAFQRNIAPVEVHEITVDADQAWVYDLPCYEDVHFTYQDILMDEILLADGDEDAAEELVEHRELLQERIETFWEFGEPLTTWLDYKDPEIGMMAEVLLNPDHILATRKLTHTEIVEALMRDGVPETGLVELGIHDATESFA